MTSSESVNLTVKDLSDDAKWQLTLSSAAQPARLEDVLLLLHYTVGD